MMMNVRMIPIRSNAEWRWRFVKQDRRIVGGRLDGIVMDNMKSLNMYQEDANFRNKQRRKSSRIVCMHVFFSSLQQCWQSELCLF